MVKQIKSELNQPRDMSKLYEPNKKGSIEEPIDKSSMVYKPKDFSPLYESKDFSSAKRPIELPDLSNTKSEDIILETQEQENNL